MKLNRKNIMACALCAGMITLGAGKTQAAVVDNSLVLNLNVQLTALTTSTRGKVQRTRITTKDLLNSIGDSTKGDRLVYWLGDNHVWIADRRGVLQEDLTDDGTFELSFDILSESDGANRTSFTGTVNAFFASAGGGDDFDSDLTFNLDGTFAWTDSFASFFKFKNNRAFETVNFNLANLGNEGFDADISGDAVPLSGSISASGSGLINNLP